VHQLEKDINNWLEIKKFLTIYLKEIAIPDFIRRADRMYARTLSDFVAQECENAESKMRCWQGFKGQADEK
jgi:hypothetical protein